MSPSEKSGRLPAWEWAFDQWCGSCGNFVAEVVRCRFCDTPWLCRDCAAGHECD